MGSETKQFSALLLQFMVWGSQGPGAPKTLICEGLGSPGAPRLRKRQGRRSGLGAGVSGCNDDIVTDVNMNILTYGTLGFTWITCSH